MKSRHHNQCPICEQTFLGYTDADMVMHFIENHPGYGRVVARKIGLPTNVTKRCDDCNKEYVTYMGACPWCYQNGPPYK